MPSQIQPNAPGTNAAGVLGAEAREGTSAHRHQALVPVVRRHHVLVRWSHWLNVLILLGLILSGISIYWASPIYQHKPDPQTGNFDKFADIGVWICAHVPGLGNYSNPPDLIYNHFSLGPGLLANALRLHWFFAYLFMANGLVYLVGLALGGGWRPIRPRLADAGGSFKMFRYYLDVPVAVLRRRARVHPPFAGKYNPLQRLAYFSVPVAGVLAVATGWAIHKPMQMHWLAAIFGGYDVARVWHFWLMWFFIVFAVPHVILVLADGWDTLRSMITGWSVKAARGRDIKMSDQEKHEYPGEESTRREPEPEPEQTASEASTESAKADVIEPARVQTPRGFSSERPLEVIEVPSRTLRNWTRRDLLLFGAGAAAAIAGTGFLLPQDTLARIGFRTNPESPRKERFLNHALNLDDDVAEALYSKNRLVPTYTKSEITFLKNNYNGATPDPGYIPGWRLTVDGLASGLSLSLNLDHLLTNFQLTEQITRLVCVEGWSAVAWWSGVKFSDFLRAYPPVSQAKWARIESSVNLDSEGNPDPYYMSLDLDTARHPQTLLATHFNGQPLPVEHGAPMRLLAPVKLGLKNVKAVTRISYTEKEPSDYWAERGYSRYDGL